MIPVKPKEILNLIHAIESKHESELTDLDRETLRILGAHFEIANVQGCKTGNCDLDLKQDCPECPKCGFTIPF